MKDHFVAFWNLENLFAPEGFAGREPWLAVKLASELAGWSVDLFNTKLSQLASILCRMNAGQGPDLLGVCEAENAFALQELVARLNERLPSRRYAVCHVDSSRDQRGIDTAFIYDDLVYRVDPNAVFSHFVMRRTGTRDITQATFTTRAGGNDLVALCNHWPSRSGGVYESRGFRMTAGETLSYWHQRILEERGDDIPVLAFGDFNDDPFDESVSIHAMATRERGDVERSRSAARFYNLSWKYLDQQGEDRLMQPRLLRGTLYYGGNANIFDQILVSKALLNETGRLRADEQTARMELFPEMVSHRVSEGPIRFGLPKGDAARNVNVQGFSDHFPVSVTLKEA